MRYVSTRGAAPELGFADAVLAGLASDGGLYVPASWPHLREGLADSGLGYGALAAAVAAPFAAPDFDEAGLGAMTERAYAEFRHPDVVPLAALDDGLFVQELFHGPTLAFKDLALQWLGRLFDAILTERDARVTIVGATSGDTGSAAIDGVAGCERVRIVILYPEGRVSEVQRRQMTTVQAPNVHTVAVRGTFDDCQDLVKAMFTDREFREEVALSAVNSINWARVMAQVAYYVEAWRRFGTTIDVAVPTGNFGNVLSGWIARTMGADIGRLVVASNRNDILARWLETGTMATATVSPTLSPSMDIQVSSNFERLLFEMNGRDGAVTASQLERFRATGQLTTDPQVFAEVIAPVFVGMRCDDDQTLAEIARCHREYGYLVDPHTAVGLHAARHHRRDGVPMVALATAHPAKFPDAVHAATGVRPALPDHLADLLTRPERITTMDCDLSAIMARVREVAAS